MNIDEDLPPTLVDTEVPGDNQPPLLVGHGETSDDDAPAVKVPITIVTGKVHLD